MMKRKRGCSRIPPTSNAARQKSHRNPVLKFNFQLERRVTLVKFFGSFSEFFHLFEAFFQVLAPVAWRPSSIRLQLATPAPSVAAGFAAQAAPPTLQFDASRDARIFTEMKRHHLVQ